MNLTNYLDNFKMHDANRYRGGYRESTVLTYKKWLTPWVEFLNTMGNNVPTTQLLKQHLLRYNDNPGNYNRIGR